MLVGIPAYIALICFLRISGKRTLSKMNAFDLVVTVALGSTLSTSFLNKDTSLVDAASALAALILLQFVVAWTTVRSPVIKRLVKSEPVLLFRRGVYLRVNMQSERVTEDEILSAVRNHGVPQIEEVESVILETDGSFSVIASAKAAELSALRGVRS